ncbi:MAG: 5'-nucleotidase C-terminal domain-containing protein, partial [Bacteroides sp.]
EIKGFLEMSYYIWTNQMKSPEDHLLWFKEVPTEGMGEQAAFQNFSFNFDSAAGIIYTVDVTKPQGEKINIISMADGSPFYLDKIYKVVTNSYRGNGGGELLTKGAGIPQDQLKDRILFSTNKDLRFYMMQYISEKKVLNPRALNQWKFIPEEWTTPAAKRDYIYLYGRNSNKK